MMPWQFLSVTRGGKAEGRPELDRPVAERLRGFYVFSLWAFLALTFGERYRLTFSQSTEAVAADTTEMNKEVGAAFTADETITFAFIEPLNGSCDLF